MRNYNPMVPVLWSIVAVLFANQWIIVHYSPTVSGDWLVPVWAAAFVVGAAFGHVTEKYHFFQPVFEPIIGGSEKK